LTVTGFTVTGIISYSGTFSNYLRQASDKMADKSNTQQQQQTGTRLSSYTSGYGLSGNSNDMFKSNNDQRVQDYKNMVIKTDKQETVKNKLQKDIHNLFR
jgi:hypothetical protein